MLSLCPVIQIAKICRISKKHKIVFICLSFLDIEMTFGNRNFLHGSREYAHFAKWNNATYVLYKSCHHQSTGIPQFALQPA